ncbi:MAG: YafY family protein [Stagnimonas sp.]|nr:YafY family protein [Stagnimonas sp.]
MSRPTLRVLSALELLQARGRLSGAELAERLGVDRRTVRRYIAKLEELGIPLVADQGRDGGYRLIPGYKLPPLMFSDDEALALSVGLIAARSLGLAEAAPAAASAQAKLERVMPEALRKRIAALGETVTLDLSRPAASFDNGVLVTLSAAAQRRQRVHLRYRAAPGEDSARDFDPYGLVYRAGRWYVAGHCHLRRELRSFRLDRVRSVQPVPQFFARPERFDVLDFLKDSIAKMPRAHAIELRLHTDLATAQKELFSSFGLLEWTGEAVHLHGHADDLDWYARELARLPFDFEVLRPLALREALGRLALRLSQPATG